MSNQLRLRKINNWSGANCQTCSYRALIRIFLLIALLPGLQGCADEYMLAEDNLPPDSPYEKAWLDEHSGNDENLGPNSPGYIGPDGEFSIYPDSDPH